MALFFAALGIIYLRIRSGGEIETPEAAKVASVIFLVVLAIQFAVHVSYLWANMGVVIRKDMITGKVIIIRHGRQVAEFSNDDVVSIVRIQSFPFSEDRGSWFSWDNYNYSVIRLRNGKEVLITSFVDPTLEVVNYCPDVQVRKSIVPVILDSPWRVFG